MRAMPQPIINEGLAELTSTLDGTRYYMGSSNAINLQGSGPYNYRLSRSIFHRPRARLFGRSRHALALHAGIDTRLDTAARTVGR